MLPILGPGDRLVVERLTYVWRAPRLSEVIVLRQAGADGRLDLKRVAAGPGMLASVRNEERRLGPDEWFVLGDNAAASTDSRELGPVSRRDIVGRAWFRY